MHYIGVILINCDSELHKNREGGCNMIIYGAGSIEDIKECGEIGVAGILTNPQGFLVFHRY